MVLNKRVTQQLSCRGALSGITLQAQTQEIFPFFRETLWDFWYIFSVNYLKHCRYLRTMYWDKMAINIIQI